MRRGVHFRVVHEREDGAFDRSDLRGNFENGFVFVIAFANVKRVFKEAIHNSSDTKRRFDDGRRKISPAHFFRLFLHFNHHVLRNRRFPTVYALNVFQVGFALVFEIFLNLRRGCFVQRRQRVDDKLLVFFKRFP